MVWDLKLEEDGGKWILFKCQGLIPTDTVWEWRNRKALLQGWLDGSEDRDLTEVLKDLPSILKASANLTSEHKQRVADWVIDTLFRERLSPEWEDIVCQTVQTLLFDVLFPLFPSQNVSPYSKELQNELHYTLRRWFALVKDPQRYWFERTRYSREQAMRDALFNSRGLRSFYILPGFPELAEEFANWFLVHYDLITCAKIHASLHRIKKEGEPWWKKLWRSITQFLFINRRYRWVWGLVISLLNRRYWWVWGLVISLLLILFGLLWPFLSDNAALSRLILSVGGGLALLLFLVRAPILPRMLGAIGVGYILLLITAEAWEFAFRIWQNHRVLAYIISLSSLAASFLYLVVEMAGKVRLPIQRCRRSLLVLGIGLTQSLIVGMVTCSLTGAIFMGEVMRRQEGIPNFARFQIHYRLFSLDFALYPEVVLFFAPVALFVGIFSQILWEEKEITSPL